jgi:NTP pyrophosphatase (non-canonical NTP hydrolase)
MANPLDQIARDWGVRCFGVTHMSNPKIRALRMLEEALELVQALDIAHGVVLTQVAEVFNRLPGKVRQELGGTILTLRMLCEALGLDAEEVYADELRRCLGKDPEHFRKRNEEKLRRGLGTVFARKGEQVTCPNGHVVETFARDVYQGEVLTADWFVDSKLKPGGLWGKCPTCGVECCAGEIGEGDGVPEIVRVCTQMNINGQWREIA